MTATKKRWLASTISLVVCFAMLLGTTYAWFTDKVTSGKNSIVAGNLDIELTHTNNKVTDEDVQGKTDLFQLDYWEPGAVAYENFTVKNVGNLALKYKIQLGVYDYNALDGHSLDQVLKVCVMPGAFTGTREDAIELATDEATGGKSIRDFSKESRLGAKGTASANDVYSMIVYWEPGENDNLYNVNNGQTVNKLHNGKNELFIEFGVHLVATQDTVEADCFDELYDENALFEKLPEFAKATGSSETKTRDTEGATASETTIEINALDMTGSTVKLGDAEVPAAAVEGVLNQLLDPLPDPATLEEDTVVRDDVVLTLNVETQSVKVDSTVLDVSMMGEAVRTKTVGDGEPEVIKSESGPITELAAPVLVPLTLQRGLKNLTVTHSHVNESDGKTVTTPMQKAASKETVGDGQYWYGEETGEFLARMSKFSLLSITYDPIKDVARIGGTGYTYLSDAFAAAKEGDVVVMLQDSNLGTVCEGNCTLDLGGHAVSQLIAKGGTLGVMGKGSLTVGLDSAMLNINGGEYKELRLAGNGEANLNGGKFEKVDVAMGATVELDINGGEYYLTTDAEKAALEAYLTDTQYFKATSKTDWYEIKEFDDNIVARIDAAGYTSLPAAVSNVKGGQTVKLVRNVNTTDEAEHECMISPDTYFGNRTIDLNGHSFVANDSGDYQGSNTIFYVTKWSGKYLNATLTFKDSRGTGKLVMNNNVDPQTAAVGNDTHTFMNFVFESGTYQGTTHGVIFQCGNVTVNGGTFVGPTAFEYTVDDYSGTTYGNVVINGGTFDGRFVIAEFAKNNTETAAKLNSVVVNGGKFKTAEANRYLAEGKILVEEDGWFVVKDAANAPASYTAKIVNDNGTAVYYSREKSVAANDAITNAIDKAKVFIKADATVEKTLKNKTSVTVVSADESNEAIWEDGKAKTVDATYIIDVTVNADEHSKTYASNPKPLVEVVGKGTFATLKEAAAKVARGDTVKILGDFETNEKIVSPTNSYNPWGEPCTIDLQGHTITFTGTGDFLYLGQASGGKTWKIKDSKTGGKIVATNGGTIIDKVYDSSGSENVAIESGIFETSGTAANFSACKNGIQISGGTFTGKVFISASLANNTKTVISGGTFNGLVNIGAAYGTATTPGMTISGGTFKGGLSLGVSYINITKGTFDFDASLLNVNAKGKIDITGGMFKFDPSAYVVSGYHVDTEANEGYYTVVKDS